MTIIYSNFGDQDTQLLQLIWEGLNPDRIIEITHDTEDYEDIIDEALMSENDTLIMCGHGTTQGLLHPNLDSGQYIIHENNVHLIHAQNVIGSWCYAADFAETQHLHGFFTGMFISNESEAEQHGITFAQSDYDDVNIEITQYETYFNLMVHNFLESNVPLSEWLNILNNDGINHSNIIGYFNFNRMRYFNNEI